MNYKRKNKKPTARIVKRRGLRTKKVSHWTYGASIARSVVSYNEFKKEKYILLKFQKGV